MARPGTRIKIEPFGGMIPAVAPQLLPETNAEATENVMLDDGRLRGRRIPRFVHTLANATTRSIYRIPLAGVLAVNIPTSLWMEFNGLNVSVIKNPNTETAEELYYWSGDTPIDTPRYNALSRMRATPPIDSLILGVPSPSQTPTVVPSGGASLVTEARSYVYTYVSVFGEEGPPSLPTAVTTGKIDDTWAVTMTDAPTDRGPTQKAITGITQAASAVVTAAAHGLVVGNRVYFRNVVGMTQINGLYGTVTNVGGVNTFTVDINSSGFTAYGSVGDVTRINRELTKKRIYRTITSAQGIATFFFVAEININITSYSDTALSSVVAANEQLTSQEYDPPPTDLEGFVPMPNGMTIGWKGKEIWFSEPYLPHAWPSPYQTSVDFEIVGIGVVGQTAVLCTEGSPYSISGIHPSQMASSRVSALPYPCMSKGSIVATPSGVFFASPTGLIMVTSGGPVVATQKMLAQADWQKLVTLSRLNAALLNGTYYCFSGIGEGCFEPTAFQNDAFELMDFSGTKNGAVIEFNDPRIAFNVLTSDDPTYNVIQDPWTSEVLIIRGDSVYQIDMTETSLEGEYRWKSKIYRMDVPTNLGVGVAFYNLPPNQLGATGTLTVYAVASGSASPPVPIYTRTLPASSQEFRLPAGQRYEFYQFELTGDVQVQSLQFATTPKELRGV
jgi:hypothetical protein